MSRIMWPFLRFLNYFFTLGALGPETRWVFSVSIAFEYRIEVIYHLKNVCIKETGVNAWCGLANLLRVIKRNWRSKMQWSNGWWMDQWYVIIFSDPSHQPKAVLFGGIVGASFHAHPPKALLPKALLLRGGIRILTAVVGLPLLLASTECYLHLVSVLCFVSSCELKLCAYCYSLAYVHDRLIL